MTGPGRTKRSRRYFLPGIAAVFLALYGAVLAVQWVFLRAEAVQAAEDNAARMTAFLRNELASSFPLPTLLEGFGDPELYDYFDRLIRSKLRTVGLLRAKVYAPDGTVLYATDRSLVGRSVPGHPEVERASRGETVSEVIDPLAYRDRYGTDGPDVAVESYIPLAPTGAGGRHYVFEAYQDFGSVAARFTQAFVFGGILTAVVVAVALAVSAWLYRRMHRLEETVAALERLLPICANCKKIRVEDADGTDRWVPVDAYFEDRGTALFSHGLCNDCVRALYPDIADEILSPRA